MNPPARSVSVPDLLRAALGGILMGLANLVPGISGGTMLLAVGIYPRFIGAVARITRLRPDREAVAVIGVVVVAAMAAVISLAGPVKDLVVGKRWVMYSLFIGLTLGGLPVVWRMARPADRRVLGGAVAGFVAMAAVALAQMAGAGSTGSSGGPALLFAAGLAGASAMILPGVSGGYLLLVIGAYVPILSGIDAFRAAAAARDSAALVSLGLTVILPVALGVVVGVAAVSNLLRLALARYEKFTLGVLIGLLIGAVVGLWPFREAVRPAPGDLHRGLPLTEESIATLEIEDWPTRTFDPSSGQVAFALVWIAAGFAVTTLVDRIGRTGETSAGE